MDVPLISSLTIKDRTHEYHAYTSLAKTTSHGLPSWSSSLLIEAPTPHPCLIFSHRRSPTAIPPFFFAGILLVSCLDPRAIPQRIRVGFIWREPLRGYIIFFAEEPEGRAGDGATFSGALRPAS